VLESGFDAQILESVREEKSWDPVPVPGIEQFKKI
jgi:hypothetical protein